MKSYISLYPFFYKCCSLRGRRPYLGDIVDEFVHVEISSSTNCWSEVFVDDELGLVSHSEQSLSQSLHEAQEHLSSAGPHHLFHFLYKHGSKIYFIFSSKISKYLVETTTVKFQV